MAANEIEVSVVMPCLNEEKTIGICIEKALAAIKTSGVKGEVVVSDNGSTDRSVEIATAKGARVVHQPLRGYGNAYRKGIEEARGRYIVMGDSDDTYNFLEIERFFGPLRNGYDMVMGSRFKGGKILPGAMPWHHQYIGNPILSGILNAFFHTGISDSHCGIRGFTKEAYEKMHLQTTGMEFASEMVINAARAGLKITEVPITYYPREGEAKLRSFKDAWRHLRFMLLYSPTHLFLVPGVVLLLFGLIVLVRLMFGPLPVLGHVWEFHPMMVASFLTILGFQLINLGLFARAYSVSEHFVDEDPLLKAFRARFTLERGIYIGLLTFLAGLGVNVYILYRWAASGFRALSEERAALVALTFMVLGVQTVFSSFLLSLLELRRNGK